MGWVGPQPLSNVGGWSDEGDVPEPAHCLLEMEEVGKGITEADEAWGRFVEWRRRAAEKLAEMESIAAGKAIARPQLGGIKVLERLKDRLVRVAERRAAEALHRADIAGGSVTVARGAALTGATGGLGALIVGDGPRLVPACARWSASCSARIVWSRLCSSASVARSCCSAR